MSSKYADIPGSGRIRVTTRADVRRVAEARAEPLQQSSEFDPEPATGTILDAFFAAVAQSGKVVTFESAIRLSAVYACIRLLSDTLASMPLCVYRDSADGFSERAYDSWQWALLHDRPNREQTPATVWSLVETHLNTDGNSFLGKEFQGSDLVGLWPIQPDRVRIARSKGGRKIYFIRDRNGVEERKAYSASQIIHIPGLTYNGVRGISPLSAAREAIGSGISLDQYAGRFFQNSAIPRGVLESDKELSRQAAAKLRNQWERTYGGSKNAGRVAVLEEGLKFNAITISQRDAQFVEQHALSVSDIARFFRVPLSMIGSESPGASLTYRTVEGDNLHFLTHSVRPWNVRIEQGLRADLDLFPEGESLHPEFLADALLRSDTLTRYKAFEIATGRKPWLRPSEIRRIENQPPDDEIDDEAAAPAQAMTAAEAEDYLTADRQA